MPTSNNMSLIIALAHELGVALEMSYDKHELTELWPEAIEGLREAKALFEANGIKPPEVIVNVIKLAGGM